MHAMKETLNLGKQSSYGGQICLWYYFVELWMNLFINRVNLTIFATLQEEFL